jgi:hypothetical protein
MPRKFSDTVAKFIDTPSITPPDCHSDEDTDEQSLYPAQKLRRNIYRMRIGERFLATNPKAQLHEL